MLSQHASILPFKWETFSLFIYLFVIYLYFILFSILFIYLFIYLFICSKCFFSHLLWLLLIFSLFVILQKWFAICVPLFFWSQSIDLIVYIFLFYLIANKKRVQNRRINGQCNENDGY